MTSLMPPHVYLRCELSSFSFSICSQLCYGISNICGEFPSKFELVNKDAFQLG